MNINDKFELTYKVQSKDLAKALSIDEQDDFPEVFATSRMIALMELACARLMAPLLNDGELSVGVNVSVNHTAATANDQEVVATSVFTGMDGTLYKFTVELYDAGGIAGSGTHTRAIIKNERLIKGANKRIEK